MKTWLFLLLSCLLSIQTSATAFASDAKQQILVLNSYNQGYAWTDREMQGIQEVFKSHSDVLLHIEYMDTKMINDRQHYSMLAEVYERKYANIQFDVLLVTDDDALKFMKRYRDEYFPATPLVFAGINNYEISKTEGLDNFTGVNEVADFSKNLSLIEQLFPDTNEIIVINDDLTTGKSLSTEFKQAAKEFQTRFQFTYLTDLPIDELLKNIAQLEKGQVIFYLSFFRDGDGTHFDANEIIPQIAQVSDVPIFGAADYMIGQGIIGGLLKSGYFQGKHAAQLAEEILAGKDPEDLPIIMEGPLAYIFDYQQLEKFGLSFNDLPRETELVNEPQTFYYRYKEMIWTTVVTIASLLIFITLLLINIRQRARIQQGLQSILETSQTLFDVSAPKKFKHDLRTSLGKILPDAKNISLIRYKGETTQFNEKNLALVDDNQMAGVKDSTKKLIADALQNKGCAYQRNEAVVPLESENCPVNLVYVDGKRNIDKTDQQLFELFAGNVSLSIEHAENFKLSASLQTAQRIQDAMLPTAFNEISITYKIDLNAFIVPAKEVGGDLYDFFALDEDHLCVCVGDVSDKGVPAAIFMAMAKTVLRATASIELSPAEILYRTNNELSDNNTETMFVTLFLLIFNRKTGKICFSNGGHNLPYVVRSTGHIQAIDSQGGTALGVFPELPYENGELQLQSGDGLLIYSDGITEAANIDQQLYGEERLANILAENHQATATALNNQILQNVREFAGDAAQSDDITCLFLRRQ